MQLVQFTEIKPIAWLAQDLGFKAIPCSGMTTEMMGFTGCRAMFSIIVVAHVFASENGMPNCQTR